MVGQGSAERRRLQRTAALDKERFPDPRFQHGKRARHRRLGKAEQGRALGDAAGFDDRSQLDKMSFIYLHNDMIY
ncbi:hypothetical protein GCM10007919_71240 [Rhizobium indigoferae]|nr:hypothetical protein GCM10007919_71240 [Rhizobium indigoferae]